MGRMASSRFVNFLMFLTHVQQLSQFSSLPCVRCCFCPIPGTNTMIWSFTKTTGETWHPEFFAVGMFNDVILASFNSNNLQPVSHYNWLEKAVSQKDWEESSLHAFNNEQLYKEKLETLMKCFNHSRGVHTFQRVAGCELDDDGTSRLIYEDAYDGNNLPSVNSQSDTCIANAQDPFFKQISEVIKAYFVNKHTAECLLYLERFLKHGKNTLKRRVRPKVRLFVKKATESAGSEVTCHVTGFYPRDVDVTWVRDRQDTLEEGVWVGEVLPNNDGTYQVRKTLTVSPEEQKKHRYTCQVDHASLKEKIEKEWEAGLHTGGIAGAVVSVLLLITVTITGVVIWNKKRAGGKDPEYSGVQITELTSSGNDSAGAAMGLTAEEMETQHI
ncbi:major histocompatibility complex class I-related gene protein-like isoform X1 [Huso huso]|uniref:Major histocompatibility complex class I-related gene protein-like isoform X1 n=1 Tax=Huso huso TaxID=61971 RepID=A0ABR0YXU3_HUSHU